MTVYDPRFVYYSSLDTTAPAPIALAQGAVLTLCGVISLLVLLVPDLRRNANHPL